MIWDSTWLFLRLILSFWELLIPVVLIYTKCYLLQAFSEAYSVLEKELACLPDEGDTCSRPAHRLLPKIIPSIDITGSLIIWRIYILRRYSYTTCNIAHKCVSMLNSGSKKACCSLHPKANGHYKLQGNFLIYF